MRSLTVAFVALMLCLAGCQGCGDSAESESARLRDKFADKDLTYGGLPEPTAEEQQVIREGVNAIAGTTNELNWERHADLIHPVLFKTDSSRQQMIDQATRYSELGWMTTYEKWEIENISPFVPYKGGKASLVNVDMRLKIWFTEDWTGRPENFYNSIRDNNPFQEVTWNDVDSTYSVQGKQVVVAMYEDSLDRYYYIQRKAMQEAGVQSLFEAADMQMLASFER